MPIYITSLRSTLKDHEQALIVYDDGMGDRCDKDLGENEEKKSFEYIFHYLVASCDFRLYAIAIQGLSSITHE